MNRELLLREVRRQGVPALALVGLSLLLELAADVFLRHKGAGGLVPMLISLLGPYLLGVAAVAPDVESGAETFLSRLPLGRGRLFLMRALVAAGWSLVVVLSVLAIDQGLGALSEPEARFLVLGAGTLAAGLLASCAIRPTLAAFLLGPLLVGAPVWLFQALLERGLHIAVSDPELLVLAAGVGALLAAWVTYRRGDLHLPGWRSLRVASAALGALLVTASGAATAAWGLSEPGVEHQVGRVVLTPTGLVAAVTGWPSGAGWWQPTAPEWRVDLVRVEAGERSRVTRLPRGLQPLALSPDGERCLAAEWTNAAHDLSVWDIATGQLLAKASGSVERWGGGRPRLFSVGAAPVEWVDGVAWLALRGCLVGLGPEPRRQVVLPDGRAWLGIAEGRALFGRGDELWLADLRRPEAAPAAIDLGAGLLDACLAGPWVVAAAAEAEEVRLRWVAPDGARGSVLLPGLRRPSGASTAVRVFACGPDLVVSWTQPGVQPPGRRAERETSPLYRLDPLGGRLGELCAVAPQDWEVLAPGWLTLRGRDSHRVVRLPERQGLVVDGRPDFAEEHELPLELWPAGLAGRGQRQAFLLQDGRIAEPAPGGGVMVRDPLDGWRGEFSR